MSELKKFASDIGVTFFASMVAMLLTFPISVLLGRSLGVEELGLYRMVSTIFGTWGLFASFGIPSAMIKYVSEYSDETETQERIISSGVSSSLILGFISFFLIFVLSGFFANLFHMPELSPLLKILAFVFPFFVLNEVLLAIIRGFREMTKNAWATITQNVLLLFFTLLLVFKYNLEGVIIAIVISSFLTTFILLHIHKWRNISLPHDLALSKQIFVFGSKNLLSNAINLINYQADILMIGYFLSKYDVGIYSVAVMFGKLIWILPDSIQAVTYPTISELYSRKRYGDINILVNRCMKFSCIFLLLSNSFFVFFGKQFIGFIYGSEFEASYISLIILLVGTVFYGITKSVGSIFASIGKVHLVYRIPMVSAVVNVILNIFLIPKYGISGGAVATSFSLIVSMCLMLHFMRTLLSIDFDLIWYAKIFGLSGLLNFVCLFYSLNLLFGFLLLVFQCIIFFRFFISFEEKRKIYHFIGNAISQYF